MLPLIKYDVFRQKSQHTLCNCQSKHRKNDKSNATLKCVLPFCGLLACSLPFLRRVLDLSWSRGRKLDENRVKVDKRPSSFTAAACCCRRRGASVAPYAPRYSCCCYDRSLFSANALLPSSPPMVWFCPVQHLLLFDACLLLSKDPDYLWILRCSFPYRK